MIFATAIQFLRQQYHFCDKNTIFAIAIQFLRQQYDCLWKQYNVFLCVTEPQINVLHTTPFINLHIAKMLKTTIIDVLFFEIYFRKYFKESEDASPPNKGDLPNSRAHRESLPYVHKQIEILTYFPSIGRKI